MSEHAVYAHGGRNEGESDEMAARRLVREHIGAHARNARVTQVDGDWVMVAAVVDVMTQRGSRMVMARDAAGALVPRMLPPGAPVRATSD